jgi:hypothetical protein
VKANANNDKLFESDALAAPDLLPVMKDRTFMRQVLKHQLRSPDSVNEPPSRVIGRSRLAAYAAFPGNMKLTTENQNLRQPATGFDAP